VAIEGCCLTVVAQAASTLTFEAASETLKRTTLGELRVGAPVNLERALAVGGRLDGHLVMGHVDGVGVVRALRQEGSALYLTVAVSDEIIRLTAARGSTTLSGVSLTVTRVERDELTVALIPHTLAQTTLPLLKVGDRLNVEADVLARYVARLLEGPTKGPTLTVDYLKDKGFL